MEENWDEPDNGQMNNSVNTPYEWDQPKCNNETPNNSATTNFNDWDYNYQNDDFHDNHENSNQTNGRHVNCEPFNDSWGNPVTTHKTNGDTGYRGRGRGRRGGQGSSNFSTRRSNGFENNDNDVNQKPAISKPTYIPPDFDDDDNLTIEAGSNFSKYDKIEVTVSGMDVPKNITSFQDSGLREILLNNLRKCNYHTPTPIQKYALPIIMDGRDFIASAQTGSGKTAAFVLPILNSLLGDPSELIVDENHCEPQALIMSPTRELAVQIWEVCTRLSRDTSIKSELLYGGTATYYQKQKILRGVHILVATSGRLIDFINRGLITFSSLRFLILDEADRMLDMGFQPDVERVLNHPTMVPSSERSTVLFSATLPQSVQQIAKSYLKPNYVSVAVGEIGGACTDVVQTFIQVEKFSKKNVLLKLLRESDDCQGTIVFVEQKRQADFIAALLSDMDFPTTSIHGDREQLEREKALKDFKTKRMKILVATAVAARGLDIMGVTMVVNFDLPKTVEEYVHRIGRTGRLGNSGRAVSFYDPANDQAIASSLVDTLKLADQEIPEFLSQFSGGGHEFTNQFSDIRTDVTVTNEYLNEEEEVW